MSREPRKNFDQHLNERADTLKDRLKGADPKLLGKLLSQMISGPQKPKDKSR